MAERALRPRAAPTATHTAELGYEDNDGIPADKSPRRSSLSTITVSNQPSLSRRRDPYDIESDDQAPISKRRRTPKSRRNPPHEREIMSDEEPHVNVEPFSGIPDEDEGFFERINAIIQAPGGLQASTEDLQNAVHGRILQQLQGVVNGDEVDGAGAARQGDQAIQEPVRENPEPQEPEGAEDLEEHEDQSQEQERAQDTELAEAFPEEAPHPSGQETATQDQNLLSSPQQQLENDMIYRQHIENDRENGNVDTREHAARAPRQTRKAQAPMPSPAGTTRAKKRNKAKATFGELGYQEPRVASPELGSEAPEQSRGAPDSSQRPHHPPQKRGRGRPRKQQNAQPQSDTARSREAANPVAADDEEPDESEEEMPSLANLIAAAKPATIAEGDHQHSAADSGEAPQDERATTYLEPPSETDELITVSVKAQPLRAMLSRMGDRGWTEGKRNREWDVQFPNSEKRSLDEWLQSNPGHVKLGRQTLLCRYVRLLRRLCAGAPKAPEFEAQGTYLREHIEEFNKLMAMLQTSTEELAAHLEDGLSTNADDVRKRFEGRVETLRQRVVPWLVLLLKDTFELGGADKATRPHMFSDPSFTSSTLQLLLRVTGWIERLVRIVISEYYRNSLEEEVSSEGKNQIAVSDQLGEFQHSLDAARDKLEYIRLAPVRKELAMERDRLAAATREKEKQDRRKAAERQMELFIQSTQRMGRRDASGHWRPYEYDEYAATHGGWFLAEDEKLLDIIRKVQRPNVEQLATLTPGRSVTEVRERVRDLRIQFWHKYNDEWHQKPPAWCYEPR